MTFQLEDHKAYSILMTPINVNCITQTNVNAQFSILIFNFYCPLHDSSLDGSSSGSQL